MITFTLNNIKMKSLFCLLFLGLISISAMAQPEKGTFELSQKAPLFEVKDQFGNQIIISEILEKSKVLLVFYRGSWCPYCKKHLSMLQENLEEISEDGTRVVIVTPEKPEFISGMTERTEAKLSIVHDQYGKIMKDYGVDFEINEDNVPKWYNLTSKKAIEYNSEATNATLPIPATFIINKEGTFDYIHFDPDYKNRSSFEEIIKSLKK